jgi:DNA replication protein DnaC
MAQQPTFEAQIVPVLLNGGREGLKNVIVYQFVTKGLPAIVNGIANGVKSIVKSRVHQHLQTVCQTVTQKKLSSIILQRNYEKNGGSDLFDAVVAYASDLSQTKHVKLTTCGFFIMASKEAIEIAPDIYLQKLQEEEKDNKIIRLSVEIFSYHQELPALRQFLEDTEERHKLTIANQLGKKIYYFDEIPYKPIMTMQGKYDLSRAPNKLVFTQYPLQTNKRLNNIYGDAVKLVQKRIQFFVNNRQWYVDKGVPYTLGLLLHGEPGTGKTSTIKSIANDTNRHILSIRLTEFTTISQLNNLFFSSEVQVIEHGQNKTYDIPVDKRIIVLEDIDCLSSVVLDRTDSDLMESTSDTLNLSTLLNILDGILEQPGRILIMTSNYPEKLDKALIRPGRIDIIVHFTYCKRHEIAEIIEAFTECLLNPEQIDALADDIFTPAQVTQVVLENIDSIEGILNKLNKLDKINSSNTISHPRYNKPVQTVTRKQLEQPKQLEQLELEPKEPQPFAYTNLRDMSTDDPLDRFFTMGA